MPLTRLVLLLLSVCWLTIAASAAPRTVAPLDVCPTEGPYRLCLELELPDASGEPAFVADTTSLPGKVVVSARIRGRLLGGRSKTFTLRYVVERAYPEVFEPARTWAYVGRSASKHPIVLTDLGPLEVEAGLDLDPTPEVVVFDERQQEALTSYPLVKQSAYIEIVNGAVAVWVAHRGKCISHPSFDPGLLRERPGGCPISDWSGVKLSAAFEPAFGMKLETLRRRIPKLRKIDDLADNNNDGTEFGGQGWLVMPYRLRNSSVIVVHMLCADCSD